MPRWTPMASRTHDPDALRGILSDLRARLPSLDPRERDDGIPQVIPDDARIFLILTGGVEEQVLKIVWEGVGPVCLVSHPAHNSLAAALEILARLHQDCRRAILIHMRHDDRDPPALQAWMRGARVWEQLRRTRIGLWGAPSDWLVASRPDAALVRRTWGPELVPLGMELLDLAMDAVTDEEVADAWTGVVSRVEGIQGPVPTDVDEAVRTWMALRRLARLQSLDALTIRCFDLVGQRKTTACLGLSRLSSDGVVAGCEGDVPSLLAMIWLRALVGSDGFMANPQDLDPREERIWLAHCTVPWSWIRSLTLRTHFESGQGVGLQADVLPLSTVTEREVTLVRVGGWDLRDLALWEGWIEGQERREDRCRTQLRIRLREGAGRLTERPLGNHLVVVPGHHAASLRAWHSAFIGEDPERSA